MITHLVAKTIVFNDSGELLVLRRSMTDIHRPGGFDFPGGKVEDGESIFAGAIRELKEESSLQLVEKDLQLVFATSKAGYNADAKTDINIVWLGFVAKLPAGQSVQLSHEHHDFGWRSLEQALVECDGPTQKLFLEHLRTNDLAPK